MLCLPQGFLSCALPFDLRRIPALVTAELDIRSRCGKGRAAVLTDAFPLAVFRRFLPVEFCPSVGAAEQSIGPLGFKLLTAAFTDQFERLSNSVFPGFHLLVALPALDAVSAKLFLPLDLLRC